MLTGDNNQDTLEYRKQYLLKNEDLLEKVVDLVDFMTKRSNANEILEAENEQIKEASINTLTDDEKEKPWHCYICGHSFRTHDNTNPDPPSKCMKCGRLDFRKPDKVGTHDPNCPRCKKKLTKMLSLYEKLRTK